MTAALGKSKLGIMDKLAKPAIKMMPKVRQPEFDLPKNIPRYWFDNNPVKTLMLAALSASFPPGERFFIDSVRHYRDQIKDPELKQAVKAFIGQEAHHSKEHTVLNDFLQQRDIDVNQLEAEVLEFMHMLRKNLSPERQLAHTAAVEHFTAIMGEEVLLKYDMLDQMDPRMAAIWAWHAIEESEHKAVAFDVYKEIGGSEFVRITEMMLVSVLFPFFSTLHTLRLLKADDQLTNAKAWGEALNYLFLKPGVFRKAIPSYLSYYRPSFHPWQHDARKLVEKAKRRWLGDWA